MSDEVNSRNINTLHEAFKRMRVDNKERDKLIRDLQNSLNMIQQENIQLRSQLTGLLASMTRGSTDGG